MILVGSVPTTPPSYAMPVSIGSPIMDTAPVVRHHEPTARNGVGEPVGVSLEKFTVIGRTSIAQLGLAWWHTTLGMYDNDVQSSLVFIKLLQPSTGEWRWYSGIAWRPTFTSGQAGNKVRDFKIHISNLTSVVSPE